MKPFITILMTIIGYLDVDDWQEHISTALGGTIQWLFAWGLGFIFASFGGLR